MAAIGTGARGQVGEERDDLVSSQPAPQADLSLLIDPVQLEYVLGNVQTDGRYRHEPSS